MTEEVKLYGVSGSPFSARVNIALELKGVDYKYFEEDLSNKSPELIKYNPVHKKIPALVHNEKPLAESLVILEYIDETWEKCPLLPKDPYERAQARFWARFIDDKCLPTLWKACWVEEGRDKSIEEATEFLQTFEKELGDKKYFGGETIGLVDIAADFIAHWLRPIQEVVGVEILNEERFPKLCRWSDEFVNHGVVKQCLLPRDKLKAFFAARLESFSK